MQWLRGFLSCPDCTLHTAISNSHETLPFQYCNHLTDCSVILASTTKYLETTVKHTKLMLLESYPIHRQWLSVQFQSAIHIALIQTQSSHMHSFVNSLHSTRCPYICISHRSHAWVLDVVEQAVRVQAWHVSPSSQRNKPCRYSQVGQAWCKLDRWNWRCCNCLKGHFRT